MTVKLYDLAMADENVRPSPFCWLAKFALLHKGVEFETVPLRFAEKENYPDPGHGKLPILIDDDEIICDSANIIAYAEKRIPGNPLTQSAAERAAVEFFNAWQVDHLFPALAPMMFVRVHAAAHEDDKAYFRKTREERIGKSLEEFAATPGLKARAEAALKTLASPLVRHKFLGGDSANLADYTIFSTLMWKRSMTREDLFETPQAVEAWSERMLDMFDGYARKAKSAA